MRFLVLFRAHHKHFLLAEFHAVASQLLKIHNKKPLNLIPAITLLTSVDNVHVEKRTAGLVQHGEVYYYVELDSIADARAVAGRCLLVRAIFLVGGHGFDYGDCLRDAMGMLRGEVYKDMLEEETSFKCKVFAFGRKYDMGEQKLRMGKFGSLLSLFKGKVRLEGPDEEFWIMEDVFPKMGHFVDTGHEEGTRQVFIGRLVGLGNAGLGARFTLKKRRYIGPTSMDAELAFVMMNMGKVGKGKVVVDPFCGTGSILVSAAAFGAHTVGCDMNILALRGKSERENVVANFEQYALVKPLGLVRCDLLNTAMRKRQWVDAIVCDPPYGIKEGTRAFKPTTVHDSSRPYFPPTVRVRFSDFLQSLLLFAAGTLVEGGRLVYWLPTTKEYTDSDVPRHPGLRIVSNCEQPLTTRMSRRLITMERVSHIEEEAYRAVAAQQSVPCKVPAHFNLASKILRQPHRTEQHLATVSSGLP